MKKTLSLLGLLVIGLMLLANPATGIVAGSETETDVVAVATTTVAGGDPPVAPDDETAVETADEPADEPVDEPAVVAADASDNADGADTFSVIGSEESSRFGTFQVEVFFADGEIVAVEALQLPDDRKSNAINNTAVPAYEEAVIAAQSAAIDVISGATVTWENYTASLESALDEAGLVA